MRVRTDALLIQARSATNATAQTLEATCRAFCHDQNLLLQRVAWSSAAGLTYVYCHLPESGILDSGPLTTWSQAIARACPDALDLRLSRLEKILDVTGASGGVVPTFHYVVETDPEEGWDQEISRWYGVEHMAGLASVPGCIRAMRFVRHDNGPRSFACYDLEREETLGSPPWLAVRGTAWSSKVRPHFTNTLRTMFRSTFSAHHNEGEET